MANIILSSDETKLYGPDGLPVNKEAVQLADRLIKAKRKYTLTESDPSKSFWKVIDEVLAVWKATRPDEWQATIIELDETRKSTYNQWGEARKESTKGSGHLRRTVDIPVFFERAVRYLYSVDELPFNKEWYQKLWERYPEFRVSEKL